MNELIQEQKNSFYYNKLLEKDRDDRVSKTKRAKIKIQAFGSQTVELKDYIYIPDGLDWLAYLVYVVLIPYVVGALFLFFAIAGASYDNFMLLDLSRAFIMWAIGYEITASALLTWILILFIQYNTSE